MLLNKVQPGDIEKLVMTGMDFDFCKSRKDYLYFETGTGTVEVFCDGSFLIRGVGSVPLERMIALGEFAKKLQG